MCAPRLGARRCQAMGKPVLCMSPKETAVGDGQPVVLYGGGRSQGFRPRRRRLSLRRRGIAVVAAVRFDPVAVSRCALLFLPHVSTVLVLKTFLFSCSFLKDNCVPILAADPRFSRFLLCYECDDDGPTKDAVRV